MKKMALFLTVLLSSAAAQAADYFCLIPNAMALQRPCRSLIHAAKS